MLIDFLETKTDKEKLKNALEVLQEFKSCESEKEYYFCHFDAWIKLEQLEEFVSYLAEGRSLKDDTIEQLRAHGKI